MNAPSSKSQCIVIVGGGIAGLSVAVRLSQAGMPVMLLEGSHLGFGASTRNQGWLYSGAWFAPEDTQLARQCYQSLQQTITFCPDCVEPDHSGMIYLLAEDAGLSNRWTGAWTKAGIPFEERDSKAVLAAIPYWNPQKIQKAWRLPDRAIQTHVLLEHLAKTATDLGVEIRTGTPVAGLLKDGHRVHGVITAAGEELSARLVILATGGEASLWSEASPERPGEQSDYQLVNLKTHLIAVEPGLCPQSFCVLDHQGFNHVTHGSKSIFGSNHWSIVSQPNETAVEAGEIKRITDLIRDLLPTWNLSLTEIVEWAGTTVQAMHLEQIEPGRATLPTVIDHEAEPGRLRNLLSVFPGRASLWPQLAEMTVKGVKTKCGIGRLQTAKPPWQGGEA
jgi:glycine/D-amino acid oxidase-like deaminating enzyme